MKYEETEQSISVDDMNNFENSLGIILPNSFKNHYMDHNGGYPIDIERIIGQDFIFPFHGFFPIKYGNLTIEVLINNMEEDFNLINAVPFAYDQGSNIFYMSIDPNEFEKIFQITSETQDVFFVCDTFDEFLNNLSKIV